MDDKLFALASFDIDNFKQVNDSFGHTTGDEMLVHLAREVEKHLRPDELFFRTGGDEFNIISNITDYKELYEHLNYIGRAVSSSYLSFGNLKVRSSLSIGGVVRTTENAEDTVQMADTQLYKSKKAGRNCVTVAE
jgi:diguanylate cyclase (GGDEF)-like protein